MADDRYSFGKLVCFSPAMRRVRDVLISIANRNCPVVLLGPKYAGKTWLLQAMDNFSSSSQSSIVLPGEVLSTTKEALPYFIDKTAQQGFDSVIIAAAGWLPKEYFDSLEYIQQCPRMLLAINDGPNEEHLKKGLGLALSWFERTGQNPVCLEVPSLNRRPEDILPQLKKMLGRPYTFSAEVGDVLMAYTWPGNMLEMELAVDYLLHTTKEGQEICMNDLPPKLAQARYNSAVAAVCERQLPLLEMIRQYICAMYDKLGAKNRWQATYLLQTGDEARLDWILGVLARVRNHTGKRIKEDLIRPAMEDAHVVPMNYELMSAAKKSKIAVKKNVEMGRKHKPFVPPPDFPR